MDAAEYLRQQHRYSVGESVYVKGARELGPYKIVSAYFVGKSLRIALTRGIGNIVAIEDNEGKLPIKPACFQVGEEVWHPDHGCGKIVFVKEGDKYLDMVLSCGSIVRIKKMRKVRRVNVPATSATAYSTESKTSCQSSPMLSNLPSRKKS